MIRDSFKLAGFSICILAAQSAIASPCPTSNVIENPEPFVWTYHPVTANNPEAYYSGTLVAGEETFQIGSDTLTTRAYGQEGQPLSIPAPTMHLQPGEKYILRFENSLPYEAPNSSHNVLKDPNITNVHTHGLHISGESPGDDVTRSFEGGFGGDFVYDIPADHMGGTFWYHAHHHGSSYLQVAGGMLGLMVVDDSADGIPSNVAGMTEKELVVAYLDLTAAGSGGDTLLGGTLPSTWTVNGTVGGNICTPNNEWQHWRILLADPDANPKDLSVGAGCEVQLLARDGVWRTTAPKEITTNTLNLTGASRADIAVRCTGDTDMKVGNTTVANIFVDGAADTSVHPWDTDGVSQWSATRPDYLRDLSAETSVNQETLRMGARTVNGSKFDENVANLTLPNDSVQEWSINGASKHPFHLHVYHVQAQGCGGDYEDGEYYDVIAGSCDIRFDLNAATSSQYDGRTIMHCHILEHEDQGAMGWLDVVGGSGPPTFPADGDVLVSYAEYYAVTDPPSDPPIAPSALTAAATSSSTIELTWADNSSDEDGFDIERSIDGILWNLLDVAPGNSTAYTDVGLDPSTAYSYRVTAYNGVGYSAYSNVAADTTFDPAFIPNAPSALIATTLGTTTIQLDWTDNSANEDGFDIERALSGGGFAFVGSVDADVTNFIDTSLNPSTTYDYQVTSFNSAGSSTPSNIATDTTEDPVGATSVIVDSISATSGSAGKGQKYGQATITVIDDQGALVADAIVSGDFTGTFTETVSASSPTDNAGQTTVQTSSTAKGGITVTFCVTSVTHPTLADFNANPGEVCASQ